MEIKKLTRTQLKDIHSAIEWMLNSDATEFCDNSEKGLIMKEIKELYDYARIAKTKPGYEEHGYSEYLNGVYSLKEVTVLFMRLYEGGHSDFNYQVEQVSQAIGELKNNNSITKQTQDLIIKILEIYE